MVLVDIVLFSSNEVISISSVDISDVGRLMVEYCLVLSVTDVVSVELFCDE